MRTLLFQAPRDFADAGIPKGFVMQVFTSSTSAPSVSEVIDALHRAGFRGRAESYAAPGNWIVKELKI